MWADGADVRRAGARPSRRGLARAGLAAAALAALASPRLVAAQQCHGWTVPATMTFPAYSPFVGTPTTITATINNFQCPKPVTVEIGITTGNSGTYAPRRMTSTTNPADTIDYNLYSDGGYGAVWTDNAPRVPVNLTAGTATIYGAVAPQQNVAPGTYTDTVQVRLYSEKTPPLPLTLTAQMTVTVTVPAACNIAPGTLAFGTYVGTGPAVDAQGAFDIQCTRNTPYTVGLGPGNNFSLTRRMAAGTSYLAYELYRDAGRTSIWDMTSLVGGTTPSIAPVTLTVYGRIPAAQLVASGSYSDTVQSTVTF